MRIFAAIAIWLTVFSSGAWAFEGRIGQAVRLGDRIWFVENFALWTAGIDGQGATKLAPTGVAGVARGENTIWVAQVDFASSEPGPGGIVRVRQVLPDGRLADPVIQLTLKPAEFVKAFFVYEGELFVLTQDRLASTRQGQQIVEPARIGKVRGRMVSAASLASRPGEVFLAFDGGEWGGGILRLDVREATGKLLRSGDARSVCAGTLNPDCHPANAVIADPDDASCVLAALGLGHFFENGSIVRICGSRIEAVFKERFRDENNSTAFWGLAPSKNGFWAISGREAFKFESGKLVSRASLAFQNMPGGMRIARPDKEILVLAPEPPGAKNASGPPILVSTLP